MTGIQGAVIVAPTMDEVGEPTGPKHTKITNEKCPHIRLDLLNVPRKVTMGSADYSGQAEYVYVSQRGYYPTAMDKANQDSYMVCENVLGDDKCHAFGVFDGHGETGDLCSWFAAEKFPYYLEEELKAQGGTMALENDDKMRAIYKKVNSVGIH
jgi:hypothetical protein